MKGIAGSNPALRTSFEIDLNPLVNFWLTFENVIQNYTVYQNIHPPSL
ncbi:hypothetical protein BH23THE1_BH23THE1_22320 [soil metagenome]